MLIVSGMSGCRESPVLEQVIYASGQEVDYDNEVKVHDNREENETQDEKLYPQLDTDNANSKRDQEQLLPDLDKNAPNVEGLTPDEQNDGNASEEKKNEIPPSQTDEETDKASTSVITPEYKDKYQATSKIDWRQLVDENGKVMDITIDAETVAAVGEVAVIVQMLGGEGRLVASSSSFTSNLLTGSVFGDEDFSHVRPLWTEDGSNGISKVNFEGLLQLEPDVCFVASGTGTFSEEQLAELDEQGIYCITLPPLNTSENINMTVYIIGQILGDRSGDGGTNAQAIASAYSEWYRNTLDKVRSKVERFNYDNIDFDHDRYSDRREVNLESETELGLFTLFVSEWEDSASYKIYSDKYLTMQGTGLAIAPSGYSTSPLSYYMSVAGTVNTAAVYADQFRQRMWYIAPLTSSTRIVEINGSEGTECKNILTTISLTDSIKRITATYYLGDDEFPAIVVASNDIRNAILTDNATGGMWTCYPDTYTADGKTHGHGFLDEIGQMVSSSIHGEYQIYVIPMGVGSWSAGSAEGVLGSVWTAMKFYDAFTRDELCEMIKEFYREFYRYELNTEQIDTILAGR